MERITYFYFYYYIIFQCEFVPKERLIEDLKDIRRTIRVPTESQSQVCSMLSVIYYLHYARSDLVLGVGVRRR